MAQGNRKDIAVLQSEICSCTICLEIFKSPKYLPCLHTYCESCLHNYIVSTTSNEKSPEAVFFCPVCRKEVQSPDPSAPKEEWASLMPTNHMINSLMEKMSVDSTKETEKEKQVCDLCKLDGETHDAEFYCFECKEYLCTTCTKHHRRSKASRNHTLVPEGDTTPDQTRLAAHKFEEPCTLHKEEVLKVYCLHHLKMCCVLCLSIDHRKCENIKTFDEMAKKMKKNNETQIVAEKLDKMASNMAQAYDKKIENFKSIEKQHQDMQEKVNNLVEQTKKKLEICHQEFKDKFQGIHKKQVTRLLDIKEKLENFQKSVTNSQKLLTALVEYSSPKQAFVTLEKIKEHLQIQGQEFEALLQDDYDVFYKLTLNEQLTSLTTIADIQSKKTIADIQSKKTIADIQSKKTISNALSSSHTASEVVLEQYIDEDALEYDEYEDDPYEQSIANYSDYDYDEDY